VDVFSQELLRRVECAYFPAWFSGFVEAVKLL
jgi:hypothetical protein